VHNETLAGGYRESPVGLPAFDVRMRFMQRLAVVVLAFAFLAAPASALCSSCCPEAGTAETLGATMPCCDEGCGPTVATAKPSAPAVAVARATFDRPSLVVTSVAVPSEPSFDGGRLPVFVSPSPPGRTASPLSVLRL
jgi:hypothetical protein